MRHRQAGDDAKLLRGRSGGKRGTDSLQKPEHPRRSESNLRPGRGVHASVSYLLERDSMSRSDGELLPGTFDMLVLKALSLGPLHGWGVADRIERLSGEIFLVQQGVVYPVLQRLLSRGWAVAEWRETENGRRARYYRLTAAGERQLDAETAWWRRAANGVNRVLRAAAQEG